MIIYIITIPAQNTYLIFSHIEWKSRIINNNYNNSCLGRITPSSSSSYTNWNVLFSSETTHTMNGKFTHVQYQSILHWAVSIFPLCNIVSACFTYYYNFFFLNHVFFTDTSFYYMILFTVITLQISHCGINRELSYFLEEICWYLVNSAFSTRVPKTKGEPYTYVTN